MRRYKVKLSKEEVEELESQIKQGGKGYRIKHAQILLKLDEKQENKGWTYDRIQEAYSASSATIAGIAKRFVENGLEAALGRKKRENYPRKVTGEVEAKISVIACSKPPEGHSRWTMQMIADELIRLEVVDYITDSTVCEVMKKTRLSRGLWRSGVFPKPTWSMQLRWKTFWRSISARMTHCAPWYALMKQTSSS